MQVRSTSTGRRRPLARGPQEVRVAHGRYACIVALTVPETLAASGPHPLLSPEHLRRRLQARHPDLIHVTVEICRISGDGQRCCA